MTRETAVKLKNLLYGLVSNIRAGKKKTLISINGEDVEAYEVSLNFSVSATDELERIAEIIEKEYLKDELLPCPFCGGIPKFVYDDEADCYFVECRNLFCPVNPSTWNRGTKQSSAELWNRRK